MTGITFLRSTCIRSGRPKAFRSGQPGHGRLTAPEKLENIPFMNVAKRSLLAFLVALGVLSTASTNGSAQIPMKLSRLYQEGKLVGLVYLPPPKEKEVLSSYREHWVLFPDYDRSGAVSTTIVPGREELPTLTNFLVYARELCTSGCIQVEVQATESTFP